MQYLKNFKICLDVEEINHMVRCIMRAPEFAIDLETTGLNFTTDEVYGISTATANYEWYIPHHMLEAGMAAIKLVGAQPNKLAIMHNGKFDMHFFRNHGVEFNQVYDTMVAQALVDENQTLKLKVLAETKLGMPKNLPQFKDLVAEVKKELKLKKLSDVTIDMIDPTKLAEYAGLDARLTLDLKQVCTHEVEKEGMTAQMMNVEMPFLKVLLDMERVGFYIDNNNLPVVAEEFLTKRDHAYETWMSLSNGVNPNSSKQLGNYLYTTLGFTPTRFTDSGAPSSDALSLARLKEYDKTGSIDALLQVKKYKKLLEYTDAFRDMQIGGRLYGSFNQTGTVTGRLSSSDPNLQNIPAKGLDGAQIRKLFIAPEDSYFVDIDYSQLEMRIGAHFTRDKNLTKLFEDGGDPHQLTATLCGDVQRYVAKALNFGVFYGAGPKTISETVEKGGNPRPSLKQAKSWLNAFDNAYPSIKLWKERVVQHATALGYVKTIGGRKRRLPELSSRDDSLRFAAQRQAANSIIQGSAADIVKVAMLNIHPIAQDYGAEMNAQVHDELAFECPQASTQEFLKVASKHMVEAGEILGMRVGLVADGKAGASWGDTH